MDLPIFPFNGEEGSQNKLIALGEWSKSFILSINFPYPAEVIKKYP